MGVQTEEASACICMGDLLVQEGSKFVDAPDVLPEGNRYFETMNIFLHVHKQTFGSWTVSSESGLASK